MEQGPGTDLVLGGHEMAMKVASIVEVAGKGIELAVEYVAGAVSQWVLKGKDKQVGFGVEFEDGVQGWASHILLGPLLEVGDLLQEVVGMVSMVDFPNLLLNGAEGVFEMLGAVANGQESMKKAQDDGESEVGSPAARVGLPAGSAHRLRSNGSHPPPEPARHPTHTRSQRWPRCRPFLR